MNCRRVFFAENEEGWDAGVNANKCKESANSVCKSFAPRISGLKQKLAISVCNEKDNRDEDTEDLTILPT